MTERKHNFPKNGSKIFLRRGLDASIGVESLHEFRFFAHAILAREAGRMSRRLGDFCPTGESAQPCRASGGANSTA
jgi:hypothetical protein